MRIIIAGDTAYPALGCIDWSATSELFGQHYVICNLEGPILARGYASYKKPDRFKYNIFSTPEIVELLKESGVRAVSLANNHINDFEGGLEETVNILQEAGIAHFGLRDRKWHEFTVDCHRYAVYGASAALTGTPRDLSCRINLFDPARCLREIKEHKRREPSVRIIAFIHWGYELSIHPQPADRQWAMHALAAGADVVAGHHPHTPQGVEASANGVAAYSLGNFIFPQTLYGDRVLKYSDEAVLRQLCLDIDPRVPGEICVHRLRYDPIGARLHSEGISCLNGPWIRELTPYAGIGHDDYVRWFRKLPIPSHARSRMYPTFYTYGGVGRLDIVLKNMYIALFRTIRKLAILTGAHRPYNW